ncbi:MAG: CotH kinase family protein [Bacteroidota bacterium]|nr:CotH kinase family protein [Bacteroidota bacterium]
MRHIQVLMILFVLSFTTKAVTFTDSNLPIVIITTDNDPSTGKPIEIPDEPKVLATMKIIYHPDGTRNYLTDQNNANYLNYSGRIGIELRGSTSQSLPKKPYGLTTLKADNTSNNNVSILGMPKENDWVLNSLDFDPSLVRDFLSYELSEKLGNYAARRNYCEVIVNGDYKGLYIFMEKLKVNDNRINIVKMKTSDNTSTNLTGGYITKCDKTTGGDPIAWSFNTYLGSTVDFIHESPKPEDITTQQNTYIYNRFLALKNVMTAQNSSIVNGYPSLIDLPSFIDFMIMNELASNVDAYQFSTYFHKDRNGKLRAGPVWDFNLTYGNDLSLPGRSFTNVWQFDNGDNVGATFWKDLFNNATFKCYLTKRWIELTAANMPLNYTVISNRIDQLEALVSEAAVREQSRWGTISNHTSNVSALKTWLQTRISWINTKLTSYQNCANVSLPPLVISKIHYNPAASGSYVSDSLEYIEITNNGNQAVDLTGIYFRELGISYQFPANSTVAANGKILLASSSATFKQFYGFTPFGQFTRSLSNKSQKLVLADAYGNIINSVEYTNSSPWPTEADGNGSYLELTDLNSDNSLASNWKASNQVLSVDNISFNAFVKVYPSPAQKTITVYSNSGSIKSYEIADLTGRNITGNTRFTSTINIESLAPNIYLLKLHFDDGTNAVKKIIKD